MTDQPRKIEVSIHGSSYTITARAEEEYIQKLASYVDEKMRELSSSIPTATPIQLAVLSAINISHELFQLQEELIPQDEIPPLYIEKTKKLITMLDKGLIGDSSN